MKIGKKFQAEWLSIPMASCPFCGRKAELRRSFLGSRSNARQEKWYDTELSAEFFPKKRELTNNSIEIGCFSVNCNFHPQAEHRYTGDPDDASLFEPIIIELKNIWNKRKGTK
jgi:hypothetical protein